MERMWIIEDSKEDFTAILRTLKSDGLSIAHSWNGDEALASFRALIADGKGRDLPQVILLDLNLPGTDGREILLELKADKVLRSIPVVVLTTSTNPSDVAECYNNGVNGYCTKGGDWATFTETIQAFKRFWLQAAILPDPICARSI
jgi:CheY-like chemotaxis protein